METKKRYQLRSSKEVDFISKVCEKCNTEYTEQNVEAQIIAIEHIIEFIKYRKESGIALEQVREEVLLYLSSLVENIEEPDLVSFYRARTYHYLSGIDITPYLLEIITQKIDIKAYEEKYGNNLTANLENNILIEICGIISEFVEAKDYSSNEEYLLLCKKIRNNNLEMSDLGLLKKYLDCYFQELKIGRSEQWEKLKRDPEELRKKLAKHVDTIFEVEEITLNNIPNSPQNETKYQSKEEIEKKIKDMTTAIASENGVNIETTMQATSKIQTEKLKKVKVRKFTKNPFISNDMDNNFFIFMYEIIMGIFEGAPEEERLEGYRKMYTIIKKSATSKDPEYRDFYRKQIYKWFENLDYQKNGLHVKDHLSARIAMIVDFFMANGDIERFCSRSNSKLRKLRLDDMQISPEEAYRKFLSVDKDQYELDYLTEKYGWLNYDYNFRGTALDIASDEAVIAMSSFYINRLAKSAPKYARLKYILDQKGIIEQVYENPDFKYEDIGFTTEDIKLYMAMYDELQTRIIQQYFRKLPQGQVSYEEKDVEQIIAILADIKTVYEEYFKNQGFEFNLDRDVLNIIGDAKVSEELYKLKEFSVKSLIYSAITDKNKCVINWGYVLEDENQNPNLSLIGFDIKGLNMPVFLHMKTKDLQEFLRELTGETKLPVYVGADDIYSYTLKQRLSTQVLYPLSKDEKKKLLKIETLRTDDALYKHLRWLQQPNNPHTARYIPGRKIYDVETGQVEKRAIEPNNQDEKRHESESTGRATSDSSSKSVQHSQNDGKGKKSKQGKNNKKNGKKQGNGNMSR